MAARAMWKAVLVIGREKIPIKLYAALQDRDVHFRLLDAKDDAPVKQVMVNPETEEQVAKEQIKRGVISAEGDVVILEKEELATLTPEPSREIALVEFLPISTIDRRFYRRPYYLGPDGSEASYAALVAALEESGKEGLAKWVMRGKSYVGALRLHQGYLLLIALRHVDEVVAISSIRTPKGSEPHEREVKMSQQLIEMLAADFTPEQYHDEYRERVLQLIDDKAKGHGKVTRLRRSAKQPPQDLAKVLAASLSEEKKDSSRKKGAQDKGGAQEKKHARR